MAGVAGSGVGEGTTTCFASQPARSPQGSHNKPQIARWRHARYCFYFDRYSRTRR
jgi:hypothetical protein